MKWKPTSNISLQHKNLPSTPLLLENLQGATNCRTLSGCRKWIAPTQGAALGCYVMPFQGGRNKNRVTKTAKTGSGRLYTQSRPHPHLSPYSPFSLLLTPPAADKKKPGLQKNFGSRRP